MRREAHSCVVCTLRASNQEKNATATRKRQHTAVANKGTQKKRANTKDWNKRKTNQHIATPALTSQTCAEPFLGNLASDNLLTLEPLR